MMQKIIQALLIFFVSKSAFANFNLAYYPEDFPKIHHSRSYTEKKIPIGTKVSFKDNYYVAAHETSQSIKTIDFGYYHFKACAIETRYASRKDRTIKANDTKGSPRVYSVHAFDNFFAENDSFTQVGFRVYLKAVSVIEKKDLIYSLICLRSNRNDGSIFNEIEDFFKTPFNKISSQKVVKYISLQDRSVDELLLNKINIE